MPLFRLLWIFKFFILRQANWPSKKNPFDIIQTPIILHKSRNLSYDTKQKDRNYRDSQSPPSKKILSTIFKRESFAVNHKIYRTIEIERTIRDQGYFQRDILRSIDHSSSLFFLPLSFISAFSLDVEVRRCALWSSLMKLFGYRARTHRDWSVFHRSSNQCSMNQTVFAPKFETFPRIFSSIYWMFSCRGARNDRHRLLIAGFPPLYRGWIDRASSLSSLQDSSSLRVLRCSRVSCVERFDCGKFFLEEMKERMMRRVDVNNKISSFFFFGEEDLLDCEEGERKWKSDCFTAFIPFVVLYAFTKGKFYSQIIYLKWNRIWITLEERLDCIFLG